MVPWLVRPVARPSSRDRNGRIPRANRRVVGEFARSLMAGIWIEIDRSRPHGRRTSRYEGTGVSHPRRRGAAARAGLRRLLHRASRVVCAGRGLRGDAPARGGHGRQAADQGPDLFFDCLEGTVRSCPIEGCKKRLMLSAMIVHLNDHHEWSREQIATWLEENGGKKPCRLQAAPLPIDRRLHRTAPHRESGGLHRRTERLRVGNLLGDRLLHLGDR